MKNNMIERTIYPQVIYSIDNRPITLITGARQVGKTTICKMLCEDRNYNYVSLDNILERKLAKEDPKIFLETHPFPLIIDEVQYAPVLFDVIEEIVNEVVKSTKSSGGEVAATGSSAGNLGIFDTMEDAVNATDEDGSIMFKIKNNKLKIETCEP